MHVTSELVKTMKLTCPVQACTWESQDLPIELAGALTSALQLHGSTAHAVATAPAAVVPQQQTRLKLDPPKIGLACDPDQWSSFTRQWTMYKVGMAISATMIPTALFSCCKDDLRTFIMRDTREDVATMPEADLIAIIKRLAVKEESILVHRIKLGKITQPTGTSIRTHLASLRGQAALCQYTAKCKITNCTHTYDYSDEIIKDNLIRGIADPEIMADLLGDSKTDRTLEETVNFIAQKEQGKATQSAVGDQAGAIGHSYQPKFNKVPSKTPCWACRGPAHGAKNDKETRSQHCPAWSFTCAKCSVKGHYSSACSKCTSCSTWGHRDKSSRFCHSQQQAYRPSGPHHGKKSGANHMSDDVEEPSTGFIYDEVCGAVDSSTLTTSNGHNPPLEHHMFDGRWVARHSEPHPMMTVKLSPCPEDHTTLGHPTSDTGNLHPRSISMVADSGCQSCIMPIKSAYAMGLRDCDIIPVKLTMRGAISEDLGVSGGVVMEISTSDKAGEPRVTKQLIYVSRSIEKAFLSREALVSLGALPYDFPAIPASAQAFSASVEAPACSCPQRPTEPPPLPSSLPPGLRATPEDVPALKQWILDHYGSSTFNTCEHQPLRMMVGEPLRLYVDPDARPLTVHKPALVPIHWQERVFQDLERDVRLGVLEKVGPNTPVTWCSRMVVAAKADLSPRRTVDLQHLNRHSVRQTHHVQSPFHLADRVPQHTIKTVTDAWNGYHSVPIHPDDRHLTTFITPWGRYRYRVAPQGFLASGDGYTQRFDAIIADFPDKVKCVDDSLKWTFSIENSFFQLCQWCDLLYRNGVTLNPTKLQFAQDIVEFAGLTITPTNVRPSSKFIDSIRNFPTPTDISGARAWFGLVNQGAYAFAVASQMKPFRHLLKPSNKFTWNEELETAFQQSKEAIIDEMKDGVRLFDLARPTCLSTDWSVSGIGFLLKQKYCQCAPRSPTCCPDGWKLCLVGSRFTTPAESRYAPIEGEALAVAYALHQTRYYILGCEDLVVTTDHKPLERVLNDQPLTDIANRRLLNLKEKTLPYRYTLLHVPGHKNKGPDAASRYPSQVGEPLQLPSEPPIPTAASPPGDDEDLADDTGTSSSACSALLAVSDVVTWDMVREATSSDASLQQLTVTIREGFPDNAKDMAPELRPYLRYSDSLCCVDGVILLGERIVIPASLRANILKALHAAHQGVGAMTARAADSVFWPGISTDIGLVRDRCSHCNLIAKSNPMQPPPDIIPPDYPFQRIACDYFHYMNMDYVVMVDRYSNWPVAYKSQSGAAGLVKRLREIFVTFGIPEEVTSDGGPQFTAGETKAFLASWGVKHRLCSVANPHANSRAEIAVKTVKRMLMNNTGPNGSLDTDAFQRAMLAYRNAIDPETKASPALVLFGRPIRDAIPIPLGRYCPHPTWRETLISREKALSLRHAREQEKWSAHTRPLPPLSAGDHVYLQNLVGNHPKRWERTGVVVEVRQFHQYIIRVDGSGRVTLRNRQHLRKFTPFLQRQACDNTTQGHVPPRSTPGTPPLVPAGGRPTADPMTPSAPSISHPDTIDPACPPTSPAEMPSLPPAPHCPTEHVPLPPAPHPSSGQQNPSPAQPRTELTAAKAPRALARLNPHNAAGDKELAPSTRRVPRRVT